jgi:hypothetical protein
MESQAIQAFINCPGIIGLALMDGRSQPHFCGIEGLLNYQQREALTQGIQQVVSTTPLEFESFTFCFNRHDAHVHKFADEVILLVIAVPDLAADQYAQSIAGLRQAFDADPQDLVTSLRMAAGTTTLEKQAYWQAPAQPAIAWPTPQPSPEPEPTGAETPPWQDVLEALDQLSDGTARYLGKIVVTNTWRSTRPKPSPMDVLALDRRGHFTLTDTADVAPTAALSPPECDALAAWVDAFITRCTRTLRDYRVTVLANVLTPEQRVTLQLSDEP